MNKRIKIIVAAICLLLVWAAFNVRIVKAGKGRIVSHEVVKFDSLTKQIEMVTPDEVQRLEDERDRDIEQLKNEIAQLRARVLKLEGGG